MKVHTPVRVRHEYVQQLQATPKVVFPLLCPVRETEWVEGWKPHVVYSHSGYAEPNCVFTTPEGDSKAVWVVTLHEPHCRIEFVKVVPKVMVTRITIGLRQNGPRRTEAVITYTYTALSARGTAAVNQMTAKAYRQFMQTWETALNDYLRRRPSAPAS